MILRLVLGALFTAMALGQLASSDAMPGILAAYGLPHGAVSTGVAVALIAGEALAGGWFLARPRSKTAVPVWVFTGVSVVWAALAAQAFARGLAIGNCGCFGSHLSQPLRWWVLVEDALLLVYAVVLLRGTRIRSTSTRPAPSTTTAAARKEQEKR